MGSGTDAESPNEETVTLAFVLAALEEFADPQAVFADARRWSRHVGVVADDPDTVSAFVKRHGLQQDYELGNYEPHAVLSKLKWEADTDRYVLVGSSEDDAALAEYVDWEFVPVQEAAAAADWRLADDLGRIDRVRAYLSRVARRRGLGETLR